MTPRRKAWTFTITGAAVVSALIGASQYAGPAIQRLDARYVHADTFATLRRVDSLLLDAQFKELTATVRELNKDLRACIRYPALCR